MVSMMDYKWTFNGITMESYFELIYLVLGPNSNATIVSNVYTSHTNVTAYPTAMTDPMNLDAHRSHLINALISSSHVKHQVTLSWFSIHDRATIFQFGSTFFRHLHSQ